MIRRHNNLEQIYDIMTSLKSGGMQISHLSSKNGMNYPQLKKMLTNLSDEKLVEISPAVMQHPRAIKKEYKHEYLIYTLTPQGREWLESYRELSKQAGLEID